MLLLPVKDGRVANHRKIMELVLAGHSYTDIVENIRCSRRDVSAAKKTIASHQITPARLAVMTDADLRELFPDGRARVSDEYEQPKFGRVLQSMKSNQHFTLQQAWSRYVSRSGGGKKYGYSQYCHLFSEYLRTNDLVATMQHVPGRAMQVDWAGDTVDIVDPVTGEITKAFLFVAVLPYSGVVFCRAYLNQKSEAWLDAHAQAFTFFGGVVKMIIPDNPTTSTHQRRRGDRERVINARYQQLAEHYGCAIVPARPRKPRDKAAAENAVNVINKRVIGYLAEDMWTTLAEVNEAIDERVYEINRVLRRANGTTRWELFETEEAAELAPLPTDRFEDVIWKEVKVGRNYHLTCESPHYSVPYEHAGQLLRVRVTSSMITVFDGHDIICEHARLTGRKGQYSTLPEHQPAQHRDVDGLWSRKWFTARAASFGPATTDVIEQILDRHQVEAQGYLDCQNILGTLGRNNRARLEAACQELLNSRGYPTYTMLKRLMAGITTDRQKPREVTPAASTRKRVSTVTFTPTSDVYVRDASHYARDENGGQ